MKKTLKQLGYETLKIIVFAILISLVIPTAKAEGWTLIKNITFETGWSINNFTCTGSGWGVGTTECNDGSCLYNNNGVSFAFATCRLEDSIYKLDYTKSYKINLWMEDVYISNSGGYPSFGHLNTSGTLHEQLGFHCEANPAQVIKIQNASSFTAFGSVTAGMTGTTNCADVPKWVTVIMNATSNRIGFKICDDSTCATTRYTNWTALMYQNYAQSYFSFAKGRDVTFDDVEIYYYDTSTPTFNQTPTPTALKNTSIGYTNVTLNFTGNMGSKYLLYQNGSNVVNFTTKPYTRTGLTAGTGYSFYIKAYNTSYTTALSNASNTITLRTRATPTLTLKTNIINYENYTGGTFVFGFNGTTTGSNVSFYCKLWAPYNTKGVTDRQIINITKNQNFSFDTGSYQSGSDFPSYVPLNLTCQNNEISLGSAIISRAVWIDSELPTITYTPTNSNNSIFYRKIHTALPFIFTYSDSNLYLINTTLCASASGTTCTQQISNWVSTSLTDDTRIVNVTNALTGLPTAYSRYFIFAQAWDGHTAKAIDNYDLSYISDGTKTGVKIENAIEITSPDAEVIELTKNVDRYNFDVVLKQPKNDIIFNLKSNGNLTYNPHSEYLGHFIDFENRKWIDFENPNADSVTFTKVSDKEYQVTVHMKPAKKGMELDQITFNSIGDLNYVSKYVYFNVSNSSTIRAKDRVSSQNIQNITVKVYTYPNTLIQTKSTTNYNVSLNITSGTYYINISGSLGGQNYITNVTANKTFSQNLVYTTYLTLSNSLYFLIFDEVANAMITGRTVTINVINYENQSYTYTTTTGTSFQSDFPAGFYEINYKATNYTPRSYYTNVQGGDTQTLYLYLLNDTEIEASHQYVNYDSVDESAAPLPNSTIKMQRYMLGNNTWRTVEMSIANDQGQGFIFADLYDATYRFIVEYPFGTTKMISAQFKLDGRDLFFSSSLLDIGLTNYYESGDVATTLTFSNTTKIWTYSFNGGGADDVEAGRFLVTKFTETARTTICNTTVSAASGGMTCNLTAYSTDDSTFLAQGFVTFTSDDLEYLVEADSMTIATNYLRYGMNGVYLSFLAVGTLAFIGIFSPVGSIIMAILGLIITTAMGIFYMSYTWLAGIIVVGLIYIYSMKQ